MSEEKKLNKEDVAKLKGLRTALRKANLDTEEAKYQYNKFINEKIIELELDEGQGISETGEVILDAKAYAIDKLRSLKAEQIQEVMQAITQAVNKG